MEDGKSPERPTDRLQVMTRSLSSFFSSAVGGAASSASTPPTTGKGSEQLDDIPREDLVHLCMKLSKRLKAMEEKTAEVVKKYKEVAKDRAELMSALQSRLDLPPPGEEPLSAQAVKEAWLAKEEERAREVEQLRRQCDELNREKLREMHALEHSYKLRIAELQERLQRQGAPKADGADATAPAPPTESVDLLSLDEEPVASSNDSNTNTQSPSYWQQELAQISLKNTELEAEHQSLRQKYQQLEAELARRTTVEEALRSQASALERQLQQRDEEFAAEREQLKQSAAEFEEKLLYVQMQLQQYRKSHEERGVLQNRVNELEQLLAEKDRLLGSNTEMVEALQAKLAEREESLCTLRDQMSRHEKQTELTSASAQEKEAQLRQLQEELALSKATVARLTTQLAELESAKQQADAVLEEYATLKRSATVAQELLDDHKATIKRLEAEARAAEKMHATRTAMLAATEEQLKQLQAVVDRRTEDENALAERVQVLEADLARAQEKLQEEYTLRSQAEAHAQEVARQSDAKAEEAIRQLKQAHEEEVQELKKDHTKKSNAARQMIAEKDEQIRVLQAKVDELKSEIAAGGHSERRIFELAQVQARREASINSHLDTREVAFQQLQDALAKKDLELATVQQKYTTLLAEATELRRVKHREGVNMDYLKNVIVQYMSFPPSASERAALVHVIGTLLQFSPAETKQVSDALRAPIWSVRPVREVKPPKPRESNSSSSGANQAHAQHEAQNGLPARSESLEYPTPSSIFATDDHGPEQIGAIMVESHTETDGEAKT